MRPIRVLFYVDSAAMMSHCLAAAELIRGHLGAHIIMMLVDSEKYINETIKNYEVYDYGSLFSSPRRFVPVWPRTKARAKKRGRLLKLVRFVVCMSLGRHRSGRGLRSNFRWALVTSKHICRQYVPSKIARAILLSFVLGFVGSVRTICNIALLTRRQLCLARELLKKKVIDRLRTTQMGQLGQQLSRLLISAGGVSEFLRAVEPDIIVLPEDNVETLSTIFIARGCARGIPSIIVPFTIPNSLEPARYYLNNPLYHARGLCARILAACYPKWCFEQAGRKLLRQPAITAWLLEVLGLSSPAPWILNRGRAASIALDSEAQRDLYLRLGFPPGQLSVTGDVSGAILYNALTNRERLLEELCSGEGLQPGRPLILCGFPPDQYLGTDVGQFEFPSYDALISAWMDSFRALGNRANILVRPHPRISIDRLAGYENANIKFTRRQTAELIPLCDLYVASISATIRWAIACGIPTVNYDTFRYRYADYNSAPGVVSVETLDEFRALIARFMDDPQFAAGLAERQRGVMKYWGRLDDKVADRLSALVGEAVDAGGASQLPDRVRGHAWI